MRHMELLVTEYEAYEERGREHDRTEMFGKRFGISLTTGAAENSMTNSMLPTLAGASLPNSTAFRVLTTQRFPAKSSLMKSHRFRLSSLGAFVVVILASPAMATSVESANYGNELEGALITVHYSAIFGGTTPLETGSVTYTLLGNTFPEKRL